MFHLKNGMVSYVFCIEEFGVLSHLYYGKYIDRYRGGRSYPRFERSFSTNFAECNDRYYSRDTIPHEFPGIGNGDFRVPAVEVFQENGSSVTNFVYKSHKIYSGKSLLKGLPATYVKEKTEAESLDVVLVDQLTELEIVLNYTIYKERAVITRSARIINKGKTSVRLTKFSSASLDIPYEKLDMIDLNGSWGRERTITRQPVSPGIKIFDSKRGTSSHQQNPFVALASPEATEETGNVYGFSLIYSGNHEEVIEQDQYGQIRVCLGINPYHFNWELDPGKEFQSPEAVLVYSDQGLNKFSQTFHDLYRERLARGEHQYAERPVLINNWEATYFNFDDKKIKDIIDQSAQLGIELFVLDDGWFGSRSDDKRALGDWVENRDKLAGGLKGLSDYAHGKGLKFGLWFEPEMISEESRLFEAHPDWALQVPDRERTLSRNQMVLDFSRDDVREHIQKKISDILDNVEIDYVKWDMNRYLTEAYSTGLSEQLQGEVYHRYILGVYQMMDYLTSTYSNTLFEGCSGGGGRFDPGILHYMPQSWTSDNTDAVARLEIQYGTSLVYPPSSMGSHVSAVPNHQTGRITSLEMRGAVAISGVFGYELDPEQLSDEEKNLVKEQIHFYKKYRKLIQYGDFYRIRSPFESNETIWQFVSKDKKESLLFYFKVLAEAAPKLDIVKCLGLQNDYVYSMDDAEQYSGYELQNSGFYLFPFLKGDFQSKIVHLKKVNE
ncbi:hypothetical protein RV02_GL002944 [Enterococcus gilvus]|nr:hypothetical protein RV02_GL002944 [Enterococcus gilvus]